MSEQQVIVSGISGRYATALFDLAREEKALDATADDLNSLAALLRESTDLKRLVSSPLVGRDDQEKAILAIAGQGKASKLVRNFLGVLAANRRLTALEDTIEDFFRLLADHNGELTAEVTSAHPLSDAQITALKTKLKAAMGRDVALTADVDETLLGGLVVKVGSRMIDSSIRTKLENLQVAMKGVG